MVKKQTSVTAKQSVKFWEHRLNDIILRDAELLKNQDDGEELRARTFLHTLPKGMRRAVHKHYQKNKEVMEKIYQAGKLRGLYKSNYFIYGDTCTGKTAFSVCLALYIQQQIFLDRVRKDPDTWNKKYREPFLNLRVEGDLVNMFYAASHSNNLDLLDAEIMRVPFLVIDDLGATKITDWGMSQMYRLLNYRYVHEIPTIFTSNFCQDDLTEFYTNDRFIHRIGGVCVHAVSLGKFEVLDIKNH